MKSIWLLVGLLGLTVALTGTAIPQEKAKDAKAEKGKVTITVLAENDKVRVQEVRSKPGDVNTSIATSSTRVLRVLKGGTQLWTFADGKTQKNEYKDGEVRLLGSGPEYTAKNIGKSEIVLYVVIVK